MDDAQSLIALFWDRVNTLGAKPAMVRKVAGQWRPITWREAGQTVARLATALKKHGFKPGDKLVLFSDNCPEWCLSDIAAQTAGLVSVPIYPSDTEAQAGYIIRHSQASVALVRGRERLERIRGLEGLKRILVLDAPGEGERIVSFSEFLAQGDERIEPHVADARRIRGDDPATIVYTSGTTGAPKGVVLLHRNILSEGKALNQRLRVRATDSSISYLPLAHVAERLQGEVIHIMAGTTVYYAERMDTAAADLKETRPTLFLGVPRVWEKFQAAIRAKMAAAPWINRKLFAWALGGRRWAQRLVGGKIKKAMGLDRARIFASGAAPLSAELGQFFGKLGMPITEAYGLTECTGVSHMTDPETPLPGRVGAKLDGTECRVAEDGEILVRGPHVFAGYYNDPGATAEVLVEGWLHTGDVGKLDATGVLTITDRKKDIIVTSAGKNVAPAPIEQQLKEHPLVSQAVVLGDRRHFLCALLTTTQAADPTTQETIRAHVDAVNARLASYETIKCFKILPRDFSQETGELTPTLKVKRRVVEEQYRDLIEAMYAP